MHQCRHIMLYEVYQLDAFVVSLSGEQLDGGGLRLSLPPKSRFQQPLSNRPNMIREPRRHRGTAMPHAA